MGEFTKLRLAALNIDGVLLNDTFSPVIHHFVVSRGGEYTADTERAIFSQPQHIAGQRMAEAIGGGLTGEQALAAYFEDRDRYVASHPVVVNDGAVELLRLLRRLGLRTVCYGGLSKDHFDRFLGEHADLFDGPGYVCTNDIRPGIHEITTDVFGLKHDEALFVDDVARVAEAARALNTPFVGLPSSFAHGFQRRLMREAGVRHLVDRLDRIDEDLLRRIDARAAAGTTWEE
ncbi:HAD family phosphatase [Streptomyces phaeofaciens]|uniref:HAD family phosphatase n=1 Tax=Streptomyces phaeofaciens TaxID=68254 RepID=UPI0036D03124